MASENKAGIKIGGNANNVNAKAGDINTKGNPGSSNDVSIEIGKNAIKSDLQAGSIHEVSDSNEINELRNIIHNFLDNLINKYPNETKPILNDASVRIGGNAIGSTARSGFIQTHTNQEHLNDVSISVEGDAIYSQFDGGTISELEIKNLAESQQFVVHEIQQKIRQNPDFKTRLIKAFKAGGVEALKAIFNHPLISIPIETVKAFIEAE